MAVQRMRQLGTMTQWKAEQSAEFLSVDAPEGVHFEAKSRFANRWIVIRVEDGVCDYRCTHAKLDECACRCEGKNHKKDVPV